MLQMKGIQFLGDESPKQHYIATLAYANYPHGGNQIHRANESSGVGGHVGNAC